MDDRPHVAMREIAHRRMRIEAAQTRGSFVDDQVVDDAPIAGSFKVVGQFSIDRDGIEAIGKIMPDVYLARIRQIAAEVFEHILHFLNSEG